MNSPVCFFILVLASGLTACHEQSTPAQADMNAETRQKAVEVRAAADREVAAVKEAAATREVERKEAATKEALATEPVPSSAPAK